MNLNELSKSIIAVFDENGNEIKFHEAKVEMAIAKYSSTKKNMPKSKTYHM